MSDVVLTFMVANSLCLASRLTETKLTDTPWPLHDKNHAGCMTV